MAITAEYPVERGSFHEVMKAGRVVSQLPNVSNNGGRCARTRHLRTFGIKLNGSLLPIKCTARSAATQNSATYIKRRSALQRHRNRGAAGTHNRYAIRQGININITLMLLRHPVRPTSYNTPRQIHRYGNIAATYLIVAVTVSQSESQSRAAVTARQPHERTDNIHDSPTLMPD